MYVHKTWDNEQKCEEKKTIACRLQWTSHTLTQPKQNPNSCKIMWVFLTLSVQEQLDENRSTDKYNITLILKEVTYELSYIYIKYAIIEPLFYLTYITVHFPLFFQFAVSQGP